MDDFQLLIDLHKSENRLGPGGDAETQRSIELAMLDPSAPLKIADIGCGTGASALQLARSLDADVTAVDLFPEFIAELGRRADKAGLSDKIHPLVCSMDALPFDDGEFDVIWSEGAIYNMGFEAGINNWRRFLKPGGVLVASEITWTTFDRPAEIDEYWQAEYPEIDTASSKIKQFETAGFSPLGYFVLPAHCWLENYYRPLQGQYAAFLAQHSHSEAAQSIVEATNAERALFEKYSMYYSYGVYIARKLG